MHTCYFNPRTREGCDSPRTYTCFPFVRFQSTHPRGVRLSPHKKNVSAKPFQSTHPRGVRLLANLVGAKLGNFNPRTREGCDLRCVVHLIKHCDISIHAPARGATPAPLALPVVVADFNPRTREGCDTCSTPQRCRASNFNPRTREGCDATMRTIPSAVFRFQSTHPRGVRRATSTEAPAPSYFNPRTREGCDESKRRQRRGRKVFQSTHPRGVRPA